MPHKNSSVQVDTTTGLSATQVLEQRKTFGENVIPRPPLPGPFAIWLRQFKSPLIGVLLFAAAALFIIEHATDASVILFVLLLNSFIGAFHEYRAAQSILALRALTPHTAVVRRDGQDITITSAEVVPGDLLLLTEGDGIVADAKFLQTNYVRVNESTLTGESIPVPKDAANVKQKIIFAGTSMTHGNGIALVTETGAHTRLGKLSASLRPTRTPTPLEYDLRMLSRVAVIAILILTACIYVLGVQSGLAPHEMALIAVALAVSAIPEGLPAVLTIVLATGMRRLARHNVLVKKLFAVEALAQIRILALDKTGTITENKLIVSELRTPARAITLLDAANLLPHEKHIAGRLHAHSTQHLHADPTEKAFVHFAEKLNAEAQAVLRTIPFDYETKLSHAFFANAHSLVGAPEAILSTCDSVQYGDDDVRPMTTHERGAIAAEIQQMAERGLRVVAVAHKKTTEQNHQGPLTHFIFECLLGLSDAIRPEAASTIARIKGAGIRVIMITGDLPATARTVAAQVGIFERGDHVITGAELKNLSDLELRTLFPRASVFARVSPEDKLRIINLYEKIGSTIAMTGDGVNDAPSLVAAHLGIAMAKNGTDVARHAADILLLDDKLDSLLAAIDEGRTMYGRLRTVLTYLISSNFGEICIIATAIFLRLPVPLTAAQIIWLNLVTDGFLDVALAVEPKDEKLPTPNFRRSKYLLRAGDLWSMASSGLIMTVGSLFLFMHHTDLNLTERRSAMLVTMAMFQWVHAWALRSERRSMFATSLTKNPFLIGATVIVLALQCIALYVPFMNNLLGTAPVSASIWGEAFLIACSVIVWEELRKYFRRRR